MSEAGEKKPTGWLHTLVDYGPLLVFLGVYKFSQPEGGSEIAAVISGTGAFMVAAIIALPSYAETPGFTPAAFDQRIDEVEAANEALVRELESLTQLIADADGEADRHLPEAPLWRCANRLVDEAHARVA